MQTERAPVAVEIHQVGSDRATSLVAAAALVVGTVWYVLVTSFVTVPPRPDPLGDVPLVENLQRDYAWYASTQTQEWFSLLFVLIGLLGIAYTGARLGWTGSARRGPAFSVAVGGLLFGLGIVVVMAGGQAVGDMAVAGNPIETVNAISYTIDTIGDTLREFGAILAGAGLVALASGAHRSARQRRWGWVSAAAGVAFAGLGLTNLFDFGDTGVWLELVVGAVAVPAWLVVTGFAISSSTVGEERQQ